MTTPKLEGRGGFRVGFVPGVTLTKWRMVWRERFPRIPLEVVEVSVADQRAALLEGTVEMCFVRLPLDQEGLNVIPLYEEVPVVWVAKDHPLAAYEEVSTADLEAETILREATAEAIDRVVIQTAVLVVPTSIARSGSRRDLVYRPIRDADPYPVGLAWPKTSPNPLCDEFVGIVRGRTANSSRTQQERRR